ncbi:hypothetical protein M758_10G039700 [Ceratodon purpureus]|nr:hypothetical protein M758_10G039700 [Ceratodon purpureus]
MANAGKELEKFAADNGINFFLVSYVDLLGVVRSKLVPSAAIGAMQKVGAGFAGYAAHFDMTAADPDMMAVPDAKSVIKLPWTEGVAWVASDVCMNGTPVLQSPRHVLRNQIEKAEKKGLRMKTGVECEFFLLTNGVETEIADVKDVASKPCYDQGALMRHFTVISELLEHMETLGWKPYQADHEDGNGQFELNWEYDDCLATADKHTFFKFMAKSVAEKHGFRATFMPKPFVNKTGNGAHCHVSVWNPDGSSNLFHDKDGELGLSELAYNFLAGVLENSQALVAILNPTVNSYKRIDGQSTASGSSWAPCTVSYTGNNRTHLLRIPDEGRFELRLADGAVNPYLLQAAILASGLDGIDKKLKAPERCDWNGHLPPPPNAPALKALPSTLLEALDNLSHSESLKQVGIVITEPEAYVVVFVSL